MKQMKLAYGFLVLFLSIGISTQAQELGLNYENVVGDDEGHISRKLEKGNVNVNTGINFQVPTGASKKGSLSPTLGIEYMLSDKLGLSVGANYRLLDTKSTDAFDSNRNLGVSIGLQYHALQYKRWEGYFGLGMSVGFAWDKEVMSFQSLSPKPDAYIGVKYHLNSRLALSLELGQRYSQLYGNLGCTYRLGGRNVRKQVKSIHSMSLF